MNTYTKYIPLKSTVEDLFGSDAWYALKESNHLGTWRKYAERIFKAVELSIKDSVEVYDPEWMDAVILCLRNGMENLNFASEIDDVIGVIAGTMVEMSFLQIGHMPRRKGRKGPFPLRKGEWRFNGFRSVVYLQTEKQRENRFLATQREKIGFDAQFDLISEYRSSKSVLSYPAWCDEKGVSGGRI